MSNAPTPARFAARIGARLRRVVARLEASFDVVRWYVKRRLGKLGPVQVLPYRGFVGACGLWLQGRVLEAKAIEPPAPGDRAWRNFRRMLRRLNAVEIPGAAVRVVLQPAPVEVRGDDEGYFHLQRAEMILPAEAAGADWVPIELTLDPASAAPGQGPVSATAELLTVGKDAEFVVVTDIDDTVIQTHVTQFWKMLRVTMLGSELTRLPFEGTDELFRALAAGTTGRARNPVFYLSRSPWNLYDLLVDFLDRHRLPKGPLLLRDWGLHAEASMDFKRQRLEQLFEMYPALPFVLVGDSGQHDPDVYLEVADAFPGRVRAIYIRDVGRHRSQRAMNELVAEAALRGIPMLLMGHAREATEHARAIGLIA